MRTVHLSGRERRGASKRTAAPRRFVFGDREVITIGLERRPWQDLYHYCMTVSWPSLFGTFGLGFLCFNLAFSVVYAFSPGCVANVNPPGFIGIFFFSVETLATVGYGDMHPDTLYGHIVASVEIFVGMMSVALITGVIFARFSRPTARFLFSDVGVVRPLDGRRVLMFRAANARQNIIMEATAQLRLLQNTVTSEGYRYRRITDLPLVRSEHPMFVLGWNMMHVIDEHSPLADETAESLAATHASFNLTLSGTDETTGQILMARRAYLSSAIRWNHTFRDIISTGEDGVDQFDYSRFHDADPLYESETR